MSRSRGTALRRRRTERICHREFLTPVRAFYLDLAQWAVDDPGRWGPWVAPCPVGRADTIQGKVQRHRKSRMDARTRERLPVLPVPAGHRGRRPRRGQSRQCRLLRNLEGRSSAEISELALSHIFVEPPCRFGAGAGSIMIVERGAQIFPLWCQTAPAPASYFGWCCLRHARLLTARAGHTDRLPGRSPKYPVPAKLLLSPARARYLQRWRDATTCQRAWW
jgi:hypothetical protein